ncbi:MAG: acetate/propionate family kinase [Flexilinea sp.]
MNILVFNCGSSSQGFKVYSVERNKPAKILIAGKAKNVAAKTQAKAYVIWDISGKTEQKYCDLSSHRLAAKEIIGILNSYSIRPDAIGHRFVHGGKQLQKTVRIDQKIRDQLVRCLPLAPIHNPNSFSVIEVCEDLLKDVPQYAVFDTAFHAQMPEASKRYAIPLPLAEKFGFQKFGFHGLSCQYVSAQTSLLLERPLTELKLILCHLGSGGSSVTAMKDGKSIDTSMGFSPLAGLVMSSRCGDLDPEIVLELIRAGYSADEVSTILNRESGLIGLSGFSSSLAEIIEAAENGDKSCQIAYDVYIQRLKKYLGAFTWLLNGADAIVFTDDIGETCWKMRERVFSGTDAMGIRLDTEKNKTTGGSSPERISRSDSGIQIWVIPTDEESVILHEVEAKFLLDDN